MRFTLRDRVSDFRNDPFFPTALPLAVLYALPAWFGNYILDSR